VKSLIAVVLMTTAFLLGMPVATGAMAGAAVLLTTRRIRPERVFAELDWTIIAFFGGLFIITESVARTGAFALLVEYGRSAVGQSMGRFSVFTVLLSNLVSNVPAVMLLRPLVDWFADKEKAWLVMAMASTYAGNLTLLGSVANLIVAETAKRYGVEVKFGAYLKVGLPTTLITTAIGAAWLAFT
jgi:Na+/H+ antiporter NhaD/arsenite permease-like protein